MTLLWARAAGAGVALSLLVLFTQGCRGDPEENGRSDVGADAGGGEGGRLDGGDPGRGGMAGSGGGAGGVVGTAPAVPDGYKLDVVFVVGRKPGMEDVQRRLAAAMPAFVGELRRRQIRDVRFGVATTHLGVSTVQAGGISSGDCLPPGDGARLLDAVPCGGVGRVVQMGEDDAEVARKLACMTQVGTMGCTFSMPLRVIEGLNRSVQYPELAPFRDDADLLIIVVTNEDDCSENIGGERRGVMARHIPGQFRRFRCAWNGHECGGQALEPLAQSHLFSDCSESSGAQMLMPVRDYLGEFERARQWKRDGRAWLRDLRLPPAPIPEPRVMVAALSGWPEDPGTARYEYRTFPSSMGEPLLDVAPVCGQGAGEARPGFRLRALTEALPAGDGLFLSVCGEDLRPALVQVAGLPGPGVARQ